MRRVLAMCLLVVLMAGAFPTLSQAKVDREPGGMSAFFVGCCFGIRVGTEWNEGADLHWREWSALIPYWNIVLGIWNGMDCYHGMTAHDWAAKNGANWY